jgi:uncharacterized protein YbjT (DUF2867 family)
MPAPDEQVILLTGATGYVGGRLLKSLEARELRVRCLARRPEFLVPKVGASTEVVQGDVLDPESLRRGMTEVETAYYLVHSMGSSGAFEEQDRLGAEAFGRAAREAGVHRIIYLGGLAHGTDLSPHLSSRQEVGRILCASGVPTIEFRASVVIGSGSLSFELVRALVDRLPVMITPRWVRTLAQPIAVEDVVAYLMAALDAEFSESRVFEIGGADRVSYGDLMAEYARQRGLRRLMIPVPVLSPALSSLWLGLVTPIFARVGRKLIDSLPHTTVVEDDSAREVFGIEPRRMREAVARALSHEDRELVQTRWSDALSSTGATRSWGGVRFGSRLVDSRKVSVPIPPAQAFRPVRRIGGRVGWYHAALLWKLRGFLDLLVGGAGLRRGRRDQEHLSVGDTVDFWRVEAYEADHLLRLYAEMKLPGRAWLQFEVDGDEGGSTIRQTSMFDPVGLPGLLYWHLLYPVHRYVFAGMLRAMAEEAQRLARSETDGRSASTAS